VITSPAPRPPAPPPGWASLTAQARPAGLLHAARLAGANLAAAKDLAAVISGTTAWIVGILAGLATLMLTVGGIRYLLAGGDPAEVAKAKIALRSAAIGYGLAVLAPVIVIILSSLTGGPH
jgi:Type IV secretion system pilin